MKNKLLALFAVFSLFFVGASALDSVVTAKVNSEPMLISAPVYKSIAVMDNDKMLPLIMVPAGTVIAESPENRIRREMNSARNTVIWLREGRAWDTDKNVYVKAPSMSFRDLPTMNDIVLIDGKVVIEGYNGPWAEPQFNLE
jgi:hypothetical protein